MIGNPTNTSNPNSGLSLKSNNWTP